MSELCILSNFPGPRVVYFVLHPPSFCLSWPLLSGLVASLTVVKLRMASIILKTSWKRSELAFGRSSADFLVLSITQSDIGGLILLEAFLGGHHWQGSLDLIVEKNLQQSLGLFSRLATA